VGAVNIPGVGTVYTNNGKELNPKFAVPDTASPGKGKYPKEAKIVTMDGKPVALYPDGSWTPVPGGGSASVDEQELLNAANGGGSEGTKATEGTQAKDAEGGYEVGASYNGMTYLGGDPNDETNWKQ
jgi:hypothetical protein